VSSYVESVLAPGERILHRAAVSHWNYALSYFLAILFFAGAGAALYLQTDARRWIAAAAAVVGVLFVLVAMIRRATTELVLTDRRIIAKRGFISRDTVEMNLAKVESLHVRQGLLGRLLGYGDVTVVGTGSSLEPLRGIAGPLELRRKLGEIAGTPQPG
jgi:uncharacterized membrane protein YdbT with pleckstrin-like domain